MIEEENEDYLPEDPEEEIPPGKLQDKWFREEISFKETVICPACHREQPRDNLECLFCGTRIFYKSGLLGRMLHWFQRMFRG